MGFNNATGFNNLGNLDASVIEYMQRATGVKYSDEQLDILRHHGGMCILAAAGSGKTTILNHLIAKRIQTKEIDDPEKLLCTTFSRSGAGEMGQRLEELLKDLGIRSKASIKTLHAVFYKLLKDLGYNFNIIENSTKMRYLREACKECEVTLEDDDYQTLDSILGYQINNLLSDSDLFKSYVYKLREQIPLEKYSAIRQIFNNKKSDSNCMDFDDMQLVIYSLFKNETYGKPLQDYCQSLWKYIYVDEAQDISKIQFEILNYLISDPNKLVFIGDDDQCIYEWRGADPSIILNICGKYTDLSLMTLTTNYRCLSNIVDKAAIGIGFNRTRSNKTMKPYNKGGDIKVCNVGNGDIYEMSQYAYKYIKELIIDKGVLPSEIAVLSRNNSHLTILNNMLFKDGIYVQSADEMKFTKSSVYKFLYGIIQLAFNPTSSFVVQNNIWKIIPYMPKTTGNIIANLQSAYGLSLKDTLGLLMTEYSDNDMDIVWKNPGIKISKMDYGRYSEIMSRLSQASKEGLANVYSILDSETIETAISSLLYMFTDAKMSMIYKSEEQERFVYGMIRYFGILVKSLGANQFVKFLKATEQFETGGMAVISPMVTMSTMHGAKGKEWKYVIIFADDNVSFPSFYSISTCVEDGVPDSDIRRMIDEDRRLHYVAMTRAKEHLVIFGCKNNLSVYTLEALGVMDFDKDNDSHIIAMAQHGVYRELIDSSNEKIFGEGSPYYMSIDVKDLDTKVEKKYQEIKQEENKNGDFDFNINNMQTYSPVVTGED